MSSPARFLLIAVLLALGASVANAQKQEQSMLDRINNPDLKLKFDPADRAFSPGRSELNNKKATVKTFAFTKAANVRSFRTGKYAGAKGFGTKDFAGNKDAAVGKKTFGQTDLAYGTRDFTVRDALEANKTLEVKSYAMKEPFVPHGKSQGTFDALLAEKNLDINQVRELLNKNK